MKKFLFALGLMLAFVGNVWAEAAQTSDRMEKVQQEVKAYMKECYDKEAFPKGIENYSMYNDDIKEGDFRYHQCLKKIIVQKIQEIAAPNDAKKMIENLDKFQEGTLDFYWILYNRQDNGVIGRMQNDAVLGRRYEDLLEDIILYQAIHKFN